MQAIQNSVKNVRDFVYDVIHSRTFFKIASATLLIASLIPNVALAVTAAVFRFFNKPDVAAAVEYSRRKFVFIGPEHLKANLAEAPLPVLVASKNLPTRSVIVNEEDRKALVTMRDLFLATFSHLDTTRVQGMKIKGASFALADSLCLGACFRVMQSTLQTQITTEEALKAHLTKFVDGFDGEASALQLLYHKMFPTYVAKGIKDDVVYSHFAQLMGLEYVRDSHKTFEFLDMFGDRDVAAENEFNALSNGAYFLTFSEGCKKGHGVVLLKYDFGSYIFDPKYGLMSGQDLTAAETLTTLIKSYQDSSGSCQSFRMLARIT